MNETNRHSILTLPYTKIETSSRNRKKTAFNTYVSIYFLQFNELNYEERKQFLINNRIFTAENFEEHEDDPIIYDEPRSSQADRLRLASRHWSALAPDLKAAWKERADMINKLPILGVFELRPDVITDSAVLISINNELDRFMSTMNRAISRPPRFQESLNRKTFGKEKRIMVRSKIFRSINFSHLLKVIIFGCKLEKVKRRELIYQRKRCVVVYINSKRRVEELFEVKDRNALFVRDRSDESKIHGCAGRMIIKWKQSGKEGIGYVMDEEEDDEEHGGNTSMVLQMEGTNEELKVNCPTFSNEDGRWVFSSERNFDIVEYEPIRIKILEGGNLHILCHRIAFRDSHKNELVT